MQTSSEKTNFDWIILEVRKKFSRLMIYLFNLGILEPQKANRLESVPSGTIEIILRIQSTFKKNEPSVGYSLLENQRNMDTEELKELNKQSLIQYMVNSVYEQQEMDLFDETENDFGEYEGDE